MKKLTAIAAALTACFPTSASAQTADALERSGDCTNALATIEHMRPTADFATLTATSKLKMYEIGASCARKTRRFDDMLAYAEAGTRIPGASDNLWQLRLTFELRNVLKHPQPSPVDDEQAVATVESIAAAAPQALNGNTNLILYAFNTHLKASSRVDLRRRFLQVLSAENYAPAWPGETADGFLADYARLLAQDGNTAAADAMLKRVTSPSLRIALRFDPSLRALPSSRIDASSLIERHLEIMRKQAAKERHALLPLFEMAYDEQMLGQGEQMLAILQRGNLDAANSNQSIDFYDRMNWWWDRVAQAYTLLGRYDEAVAAMRKGIAAGEGGRSVNVSQVINLAVLQVRFGHAADALATLTNAPDQVRQGSAFGQMEWHSVHGCASHGVGDDTQARSDLAYMQAHALDDENALFELQACMGDFEGAAATLIRRLDDPLQQSATLMLLSDHQPWPRAYAVAPWETALAVLKRRSDVQAAVGRAGGTGAFNIALLR